MSRKEILTFLGMALVGAIFLISCLLSSATTEGRVVFGVIGFCLFAGGVYLIWKEEK